MVEAWGMLLEGRKEALQAESENTLRRETKPFIEVRYGGERKDPTHQEDATYGV